MKYNNNKTIFCFGINNLVITILSMILGISIMADKIISSYVMETDILFDK